MAKEVSEFDSCSTPPNLTLNSFPFFKRMEEREMPGMATPPIRLPGAIPFRWEEAPGRPKQKLNQLTGSAYAVVDADRRLGLPPRLSASASTKEERRGIMVLDGPYFLIRRRPLSFSVRKQRLSFGKKLKCDVSSDKSSEDTPNSSVSAASSSFKSFSTGSVFSYSNGGSGESGGEEEEGGKEEVDEEKEEERKVRILRCKRHTALTRVTSYAASHFWASIIGRLKQATTVPYCWRNPKI